MPIAEHLESVEPGAATSPGARVRFAPLSQWREGGRSRAVVVVWLCLCLLVVPSGMLTRLFEWSGIPLTLAGSSFHVTLYLPMLACVPLVLWYGYWWAAIPAYLSTFCVALLGSIPMPWIFVFCLANPLGLAIFALHYRVVRMPTDLCSLPSLLGFVAISLLASLAGSVGSFIWAYTNSVGANVAYPIWQGWWLGGWLQCVLIVAPLLWLFDRPVRRWLAPAASIEEDARTLRRHTIPAIAAAATIVLGYVAAARYFSLHEFRSALANVPDQAARLQLGNAVDGLSFPLLIMALVIVAVSYFGYRATVFWTDRLRLLNAQLREQNEQLVLLATTDELSGVLNRRRVLELVGNEFLRARRTGLYMSVLMIDADHFKSINDHHGHRAGDEVIRGLADRIEAALRDYDVLGRYGGEEFIVMLPETVGADAVLAAERICAAVRDKPFHTCAGVLPVTVSVGVASMNGRADHYVEVVERADRALYAAKAGGRDRAVLCPHSVAPDSPMRVVEV